MTPPRVDTLLLDLARFVTNAANGALGPIPGSMSAAVRELSARCSAVDVSLIEPVLTLSTAHELGAAYTVERVIDGGDEGAMAAAYVVTGARGAKYTLLRNVPNPSLLFSINATRFLKSGKIAGREWFTDHDGVLRPVRT